MVITVKNSYIIQRVIDSLDKPSTVCEKMTDSGRAEKWTLEGLGKGRETESLEQVEMTGLFFFHRLTQAEPCA